MLALVVAPIVTMSAQSATSDSFTTVMEERSELPGFTVYRPANLERVEAKLPIVAWANGGCVNLGNSAENLLNEIASHGYLVIAIGPIGAVTAPATRPARTGSPEEQLRSVVATSGPAPTRSEQLIAAIDWAVGASRAGAFAGKIDADHVALAGHSCGGLQAIAASHDSRVDTTVVLNSGVFDQPRVKVDKAALANLHAPIAYFIGGSSDMAYANAEDDFKHIVTVPVLKANNTFGHGGRLKDEAGGPTAQWVVRWLNWILKDDTKARASFVGPQCALCRESGWSLERKRMDE
jgi:dienelactone hydrolase